MSAELFSKLFLGDSSNYAGHDSWLETILKKELGDILATNPRLQESGCLLADIGSFMVQALATLSELSRRSVTGEHVDIYVKSRIQEMEIQDGFSNLRPINYMNDKHNSLKAISSRLKIVAEDVDTRWKLSPPSPFAPRESPRSDSGSWSTAVSTSANANYGATAGPSTGPWQTPLEKDEEAGNEADGVDSPASDPGIQDSISDILNSISARGKGQHVCPYQDMCTKGGVRTNGEIVVFERNSAFKSHLQKHERSFKCNLPGCTNKKGFTRLDQLQRHQRKVTHGRS